MSLVETPHIWTKTPLIRSYGLSERAGTSVWVKLETLQPAQSFKFRGISHFITVKHAENAQLHFVIASSGNAAIAASLACKTLGARCTTFVPVDSSEAVVSFLRNNSANVVLEGDGYPAAFAAAKRFVADATTDETRLMIPSYDHPLVWEGHSSMIDEIASQLPEGVRPDAVVCAVGGGGLLGGVLAGCERQGWNDVRILTVETHGAACFYHSILLNKNPSHALPHGIARDDVDGISLARLPSITSRASSLGALSPSAAVVRKALAHPGGVIPISITDERCMQAALLLAESEKVLVELACAAAVAAASDPDVLRKSLGDAYANKNIVVIACGGFKISMQDMMDYHAHLSTRSIRDETFVTGETL